MASEVDICNKAMIHLGANQIISLDDPQKEASLCKQVYADLRDAVLQAHDWTFAVQRQDLPKGIPDPTFRYANRYPLPSGVLQVMEVNQIDRYDERRDWQVEQNAIVTDDNQCRAKLLYRIEDTLRFSNLFIECLAARIAADLCIALTADKELEQVKFNLYTAKVREAASRDNQQGKSRRLRSRWLLNARHSSGPQSAGPVV